MSVTVGGARRPLAAGRIAQGTEKLRSYFRAHPALFLGLLAPMVEYLSGSTQVSWLLVNPILFFAFLAQNLGSYGLAVLLIHEARVRWRKGWATVLLLGAAYGIINEGVGAATLFNPGDASVLGVVSTYGHWMGVNWPWATQLVLIIHPLFSVTLPLLLLYLTFPETRGRSLLSARQVRWALAGLAVDALGTLVFVGYVRHFYAGPVLWAGCALGIAGFVAAAYLVRADLLRPSHEGPTVRPLTMFFTTVGLFVLMTFGSDALASLGVAPVVLVAFFAVLGGLGLLWAVRHIGRRGNELTLLALGAGLVAVLLPQGFFGQIGTGVGMVAVIGYEALVVLFLFTLWKRYRSSSRGVGAGGPLATGPAAPVGGPAQG